MDVHRCRFVPYPPSAINAVAFSHPSSLTSNIEDFTTLRLAIGRANGDIEIWNPLKGLWFQESILRGGKNRSIEGLVWTQDPDDFDKHGSKVAGRSRLFSIGYSTVVTEWDLALGKPLRHSTGNYGEIWCIAAQPVARLSQKAPNEHRNGSAHGGGFQEQNIIAGCANGAIAVFTTADGNLQYLKVLARSSQKKARVLSITYQNRDIVVAGYADSTIRVFDTRNGHLIRNMSLGASPIGGPKEILVWSVKCLPDGTVVSGDSTGTLSFWEGRNYTLLQRIKSHLTDILDVATSADGETVFSGGMDRRTALYQRIGSGDTRKRRQWAKVTHRRQHQHDVKTMATFEAKDLSVLISGGLDTNPIITPIKRYGKEFHRAITGLPLQPCIGGASGERLMMSWWAGEINIWWIPQYGQTQRYASEETNDQLQTRKLAAKIFIQGDESIAVADLTSDGRMLAACTMSGVKVFRLRLKASKVLKVSGLEIPLNIRTVGARMVKFSPDGKWLVLIRADSSIQISRINDEGATNGRLITSKRIILKRLPRDLIQNKIQHGSLGNYERSINRIAFSADSRIFVVGDLSGYIDSWVLEGHEDLMQDIDEDAESSESLDEDSDEEVHPQIILGQHWIRNPAASLIPKLSAAALILSFRPSTTKSTQQSNGTALHPTRRTPHPHSHDLPQGEDQLFALTSEHQMYELNVLSGRLSNWARRNPSRNLPKAFRDIKDRAMGSIWDIKGSKERIWLYGSNWLYMFDLAMDLPAAVGRSNQAASNTVPFGKRGAKQHKRKREVDDLHVEERRKPELDLGIGRKYRKMEGPKAENFRWVDTDQGQAQASPFEIDDDDDVDAAANEAALLGLRRGPSDQSRMPRRLRDENTATDGEANEESTLDQGGVCTTTTRSWWGTHTYREILGIVPLGIEHEQFGNGVGSSRYDGEWPRRVEVALIERPLWEVDLPPRYYGDQEWDDKA